jgi:hypothetical protein
LLRLGSRARLRRLLLLRHRGRGAHACQYQHGTKHWDRTFHGELSSRDSMLPQWFQPLARLAAALPSKGAMPRAAAHQANVADKGKRRIEESALAASESSTGAGCPNRPENR